MYLVEFTLADDPSTYVFNAPCLAWAIEGLAFNLEALEDESEEPETLTISIVED